MPREVRQFAVTVPKGTAKAAPQETQLTMPPRVIRQVRVRVPPGPLGVVGFQLGNARTQVLPANPGEWIVADDETIPYATDGYITSGTWWLIAYNTGTYDHTLQVAFDCTLPVTTTAGVRPIPGNHLSTGGGGSGSTGSGATGGQVVGGSGSSLPSGPSATTPPTVTLPTAPPVATPPRVGSGTPSPPTLPPPPPL